MGFDKKFIELKNPHNSKIWETCSDGFPNIWEYFFPDHRKKIGTPTSFPLMDIERFFRYVAFKL